MFRAGLVCWYWLFLISFKVLPNVAGSVTVFGVAFVCGVRSWVNVVARAWSGDEVW